MNEWINELGYEWVIGFNKDQGIGVETRKFLAEAKIKDKLLIKCLTIMA